MQWTGTWTRGLNPRSRKRKIRERDVCVVARCVRVQRENRPTVPLIGGRAPEMRTVWSPLHPQTQLPVVHASGALLARPLESII
jgi:hypothetical protein